ncbi:alcohol-forming fatty acyl-CoA reductase, partial [Sarracenia purpurea var. burkii]
IPCLKEPFAGWTDGFYGPNGLFALPLLDIVPAVFFENDARCDLTPADILANALIALTQYSYN